jgi:V/A-type H+-transporting ATPase subunit C
MGEIGFPVDVDREIGPGKAAMKKVSRGLSGLEYDEFVVSDDWTWGDDTRYCFATGYLRAAGRRLISDDRFARLAEARDQGEILAMLGDTDYASWGRDRIPILDAAGPPEIDVESILGQEAKRVHGLVGELTRDRDVTDILFLREDFFNLKLAVKGIVGDVPVADFFSHLGTIDPARIYDEVRQGGAMQDIPRVLGETAVRAIETYTETKDPARIDRVVDAAMFEHLQEKAEEHGVFFLHRLLAIEIDLVNILIFFRLKWAADSSAALQAALLSGGRIGLATFSEYLPREIDDIETGFLAGHRYRDFIAEGITHLKNERSFVRMEALIERQMLRFIERELEVSFGVEPLIAYFYRKSIEMRRLATVLAGKKGGLPAGEIKARLGYVG